jgi:hypothetical protein
MNNNLIDPKEGEFDELKKIEDLLYSTTFYSRNLENLSNKTEIPTEDFCVPVRVNMLERIKKIKENEDSLFNFDEYIPDKTETKASKKLKSFLKPKSSKNLTIEEKMKEAFIKIKNNNNINKPLTPIEFILALKQDKEEREQIRINRDIQARKDKIKAEKLAERERFWKEFKATEFLYNKYNQLKNNITSHVNVLLNKINAFRFYYSLEKDKRELIKNIDCDKISPTLLNLAIKKNISMSDIRETNRKMNLIKE